MTLIEARPQPQLELYQASAQPRRPSIFRKKHIDMGDALDPATPTDFVFMNGKVQQLTVGDRVLWTPASNDPVTKLWIDFGQAPSSTRQENEYPTGIGAHIHIVRPHSQVHSWWTRVHNTATGRDSIKEPFMKTAMAECVIVSDHGGSLKAWHIKDTGLYFRSDFTGIIGEGWELRLSLHGYDKNLPSTKAPTLI